MPNWLHRLFNPHCPSCELIDYQERERIAECKSCETLKVQLELANRQIELLIKTITNKNTITEVITHEDDVELKPLPTSRKHIPFQVRQQMVEREDLKTLDLLKGFKKDSETLVAGIPSTKSNEEIEEEIQKAGLE
jgi:hypothetical protein